MVAQLLWFEFVLKLAVGVALAGMPRLTIRLLGLPQAAGGSAFWPRFTGVLLVGIACASFLHGWRGPPHGLGLSGSSAINACLALAILMALVLDQAGLTRHGRLLLALTALLLATISIFEAAVVGSGG
jgi:hypothetical protein